MSAKERSTVTRDAQPRRTVSASEADLALAPEHPPSPSRRSIAPRGGRAAELPGAANALVASLFRRVADLLEIQGANPFRVRAYRRAAATATIAQDDFAILSRTPEGRRQLDRLPGIGPDLVEMIGEICRTQRLRLLEDLEAQAPAGLAELLALPGLGPVRVGRLRRELAIRSVDDLRKAVGQGDIARLPGFGRDLEARLSAALSEIPAPRWPLATAELEAEPLLSALLKADGVVAAAVAGSIRRRRPMVGDIDLVAAASPRAEVGYGFVKLPQIHEVLSVGSRRARMKLANGLQVDLLIAAPGSYGAALVHFTGSKAHNISLRRRAQSLGLKLNEHGVFEGRRRIAGRTESEVYAALGLGLPEPTAREGVVEVTLPPGSTFIEGGRRASSPRKRQTSAPASGQGRAGGEEPSAAEQDTVIREMDHRLKNQLQLLASYARLASKQRGLTAGELAEDLAEKLTAIAGAHDALHRSPDAGAAPAHLFLEILVKAFAVSAHSIEIECDPALRLPASELAPLGMIVSEAISNALKHAFPDGREGRVRVRLVQHGGRVLLTVRDDGRGIPQSPARRVSGRSLMDALARQLGGRLRMRNLPGGGGLVALAYQRVTPTPGKGAHQP